MTGRSLTVFAPKLADILRNFIADNLGDRSALRSVPSSEDDNVGFFLLPIFEQNSFRGELLDLDALLDLDLAVCNHLLGTTVDHE